MPLSRGGDESGKTSALPVGNGHKEKSNTLKQIVDETRRAKGKRISSIGALRKKRRINSNVAQYSKSG